MATTLQQIYEFETRFEEAVKAVLVANGLTPFDPRSSDYRERSNLSVSFRPGSATDEMVPTQDGAEYCAYTGGELLIQVEWPREGIDAGEGVQWSATPEPVLMQILAQIRVIMRQCKEPLNPDNLLYCEVTKLRPAGDSLDLDTDAMLDVAKLRWGVDFRILPDAFDSVS